ncbi:relaxase/mobilization nuclease domain-containing protein [Roseateles sp.]|uniref:relaxase/mobilization nuclease domain-containing protein n=1 Tax=Roseateles sp. TaxID=1971397 RepID=UPI002DF89394|nr:conjugal transfer protein TraS [Roseateles sp.]
MSDPIVGGILVRWGEPLFYPANRIVKADPTPRLAVLDRRKAAIIRQRIEALVVRRAPQVMVKIVGGGRGMRAIKAQFDYITHHGSLEMEDDRGVRTQGKDALDDMAYRWRVGGSLIDEVSHRHEALYVTLSMPFGVRPSLVLQAARAFAHEELPDSQYVMVLHEHQANPHVHLAVRAQTKSGMRLNPWSDRHRWRETFAEKLRDLGVDAEASPQSTRGEVRKYESPWLVRNDEQGQHDVGITMEIGSQGFNKRAKAMQCWSHILTALARSPDPADRALAEHVAAFLRETPFVTEMLGPPPERDVAPAHNIAPGIHAMEHDRAARRLTVEWSMQR